ncbi:MAG TPA: urease accessory protein UreD, partial [Verrucomicrobiota bacterium]|nr:urease accessory protein UreD [Verrucomicrobiota bacterium]
MVPRVDPSGPVRAGVAQLCVKRVEEESAVVRAEATSPLKILTPRARGQSVWAYLSSYGGGMVAGDSHRLDVRLGPDAQAFFGTQSSTKVYRTPDGRVCEQRAIVEIGVGGFLAWVPDPVQPFAGAVYRQHQEFRLQANSSLVFLDSFTAGRSERGEHWAFTEYRSRTEFWVGGTRRLVDSIFLSSDLSSVPVQRRMS